MATMNISKGLYFDRLLIDLKAQNQRQAFDVLAKESATLTQGNAERIRNAFQSRLEERTFGMGNGLSIFDIKSPAINKPVLIMARFEQELDFNALDGRPVDLMAAVISPQNNVSEHLQKLAYISRVLRSEDLCAALRDAPNEDAMTVLFMPSQDWMIAA